MAKSGDYTLLIIAVVLVLFIYGGQHGWFQHTTYTITESTIDKLNNPPITDKVCTLSVSPLTITAGDTFTGRIKAGPRVFCEVFGKPSSGGDWNRVYEGTTDINGDLTDSAELYVEGSFIFKALCGEDCVTNEATLNVNPISSSGSCTDSDGRDRDKAGWVTFGGVTYYDKCLDVGAAVTEYTCVDNSVFSENLMCDYGQECYSTRSGGYCRDIDTSWSPGDIVWSGSNSGTVNFASGVNLVTITPGEMGFEAGGPCHLEVDLITDWNYVQGEAGCVEMGLDGIPHPEKLKWDFYDSSGLRYSRLDPYPRGVSETIYPVNYDGQNMWKLQFTTVDPVPGCTLSYSWDMKIKIAECD